MYDHMGTRMNENVLNYTHEQFNGAYNKRVRNQIKFHFSLEYIYVRVNFCGGENNNISGLLE